MKSTGRLVQHVAVVFRPLRDGSTSVTLYNLPEVPANLADLGATLKDSKYKGEAIWQFCRSNHINLADFQHMYPDYVELKDSPSRWQRALIHFGARDGWDLGIKRLSIPTERNELQKLAKRTDSILVVFLQELSQTPRFRYLVTP